MDQREQLLKLNQIGIALSNERNLGALLDLILHEARNFTRAEAGTLFTRHGEHLKFEVAHNDVLSEKLGRGNTARHIRDTLIPITKQSLAGYTAATGEVLNIPDAYAIPAESEYRFNDEYDRRNGFRTQSLLVVPMKSVQDEVIGVLQLLNARDEGGKIVPFDRRFEMLVLSLASQAAVAYRNACLTQEIKQAYLDTILRLSIAAEYRDTDTAVHIRRMSLYSAAIAEAMPLPADEVEQILFASPMHDIGKIGVSDRILQKPGKLTEEEFAEMKKHTTIGAAILDGAEAPVLKLSCEIALAHHEKWDGSGYPAGVKGADIPLPGRIVAVADVFDALASARCYKPAMPFEKAVAIVEEGAGKHFDPDCVAAFRRALPKIRQIYDEYRDEAAGMLKLSAAAPFPAR
ncbi:MAG: HD domain-containing protein [Candidatus Brocadiae bacterium]|nr:HD domain-containing protein [Candidatus Brocadiia bacterium]